MENKFEEKLKTLEEYINKLNTESLGLQESIKLYEAAKALKMTSVDLYKLGIVDKILPEYGGGAHKSSEETAMCIKQYLIHQIKVLNMQNRSWLIKKRKQKFQMMGKGKKL